MIHSVIDTLYHLHNLCEVRNLSLIERKESARVCEYVHLLTNVRNVFNSVAKCEFVSVQSYAYLNDWNADNNLMHE